ncbi:DNA-3-methyladenine glycosylase I [Conexibacter stalactiti]|uniref:DNA-3-methyladenine glycosylase I n=2 Tax=Conexibacter stalactiti TaxID=1940611 RepID=A0ABU4HQH9_9ACTN|nr:DNA-3-methyladenine glycosylase I [Conexibacter stalactiti]MDW5595583.1 DNA-3-methyladenine glycosylase I [Conexibacter stalactiti]MEC5036225.1 DNA-3-methyladenine glycosylase I [Conexibacter stalactiti]
MRCFGDGNPLYERYHDEEWGFPVRDERAVYERISLEAFQSGLAWITILRKREGFRAAFAGFDPELVAQFGDDDVARLMADAGIVRNRMKIEATIANARAVLELRAAGIDLAELLWSFAPERAGDGADGLSGLPATTTESRALAKALKSHGFRFVGPTTAYAAMQACGVVNDHLAACPTRPLVERARQEVLS